MIRQKIDEFNMDWGFFLFLGMIITGISLIVLTPHWVLGATLIFAALLTITRQIALLEA